eukprot:TRINITY_DN17235_c0_g1_i1.p1 TRINITY_DN17235_c0_g1~~TRINITY_DN17235_c0_g1_i1.p1  ORF type:complete len:511 (+),score=112.09 TRINITY_DN17235_c0_g1_i1:213-1745(+)
MSSGLSASTNPSIANINQYLQEILELERTYHSVVQKRIDSIQNSHKGKRSSTVAELEKQELQYKQLVAAKKDEFRKLSEVENRNSRLRRQGKSFRISYQNLNANSRKQDAFGRTPAVKLETIMPEHTVLFNSKAESLPQLKIKQLKKRGDDLRFVGPKFPDNGSSVNPPAADTLKGTLCARSVSTYPQAPDKINRIGDPICDSYCIQLYENGALLTLADGCNWGPRPYNASKKASQGFCSFIDKHAKELTDLTITGHTLLNAIAFAHNAIIDGFDEVFDAGTTTLTGGVLLELESSGKLPESKEDHDGVSTDHKWVFVTASVGDCKIFHYSAKNKVVVDVTEGNRFALADASDPGGRIGPYLHEGAPDFRNLDLYFQLCSAGDFIMVVSDGVHDNVDPQTLGKSPKTYNIAANTWEEAEKQYPNGTEEAKNSFRKKWVERTFHKLIEEYGSKIDPNDICDYILDYCIDLTRSGRDFLENNPNKRLSTNYVEFPGKPDHATIIVLRVGRPS